MVFGEWVRFESFLLLLEVHSLPHFHETHENT